jgi:hypothetical protein
VVHFGPSTDADYFLSLTRVKKRRALFTKWGAGSSPPKGATDTGPPLPPDLTGTTPEDD